MAKLTKKNILQSAIELFNNKGYVNVRMRDIAGAVGISPGNLTYHFKTKDSILERIYESIIESRHKLLTDVQLIPSIATIHGQLVPLMQLYKKYRFFYLDILEIVRAHPQIAKMHQTHIEVQINYIKAIIDYSVGSGNMKAEPYQGYYEKFAHTIWMILSFWLSQAIIRGQKADKFYEDARNAMWDLVLPHFTEKGHTHYQKIYAQELLKTPK